MNVQEGGRAEVAASGPDPRGQIVRGLQAVTTATLRFTDRQAAVHGLHRSDLQALQLLVAARAGGAGPMSPGRLAKELEMSPSAVTTLVQRLERAGHVDRQHDPDDRRRVGLLMTERAGTAARAMFGPMSATLHEALGEFDEAELAAIGRFLDLATQIVDAAGSPSPAPDPAP